MLHHLGRMKILNVWVDPVTMAEALNPLNADAFANHAAVLQRLGRNQEALEMLNRAAALETEGRDGHDVSPFLHQCGGQNGRSEDGPLACPLAGILPASTGRTTAVSAPINFVYRPFAVLPLGNTNRL